MDQLFDGLFLIDVYKDLTRNIASLITSENIFADLSDSPEDWETDIQVEFEDALWDNAIAHPFDHLMKSRF